MSLTNCQYIFNSRSAYLYIPMPSSIKLRFPTKVRGRHAVYLTVDRSAIPDMVYDEAWWRDEEIVDAVEAVAHRWGVDGVVGRSATSLLDHLGHNVRSMWRDLYRTEYSVGHDSFAISSDRACTDLSAVASLSLTALFGAVIWNVSPQGFPCIPSQSCYIVCRWPKNVSRNRSGTRGGGVWEHSSTLVEDFESRR